MKTSSVSLYLLSATLFAGLAFAQAEPPPPPAGDQPPPPPGAPGDHPDFHQRMLEKFDANHDGKLDESERAAAREAWRQRHARDDDEGGPGGPPPHEGPGGPPGLGGPGDEGMPPPRGRWMRHMHREMMKHWHEEMLAKFDANHDGKLDETERAAARKAGEERRAKFQQERQQVLERFDANHDGKLDETERKALHDAWQEFLKARPVLPTAAPTPAPSAPTSA